MTKEKRGIFFKLIPHDELSPEQKEFELSQRGEQVQFYKFLREPTRFNEIDWRNYRNAALWRNNGTFICFPTTSGVQKIWKRRIYFKVYNVGKIRQLRGDIYGKTDAAIAETAAFFLSLKLTGKIKGLQIGNHAFF
jgi:hypothetical protein